MDQTSTHMNTALAAAAGDDHALIAELHEAFRASVHRQIDLLKRSRCDGNWNVASLRLKGLAASFHAEGLIAAADDALGSAPGDPVAIRTIEAELDRIGEPSAMSG